MKKTSRRGFGKQLTYALGAIPIASLAAKSVGAQVNPDTPITVGGGGGRRKDIKTGIEVNRHTYVKFNRTYYRTTDTGDERHFRSADVEPNYVLFFSREGDTSPRNLTRFLDDGNITLKFQDSDERIRITQNPFGVRFKTRQYDEADGDENRRVGAVLTSIEFKHKVIPVEVGLGWRVCISKDPEGGDCRPPRP